MADDQAGRKAPLDLPCVDLASPDAPDLAAKACAELGFFEITGHGVSQEVIDEAFEALDAFFALPLEEKLRWRPPAREIDRGYAPMGSEGFAYSLGQETPADLVEAFVAGCDSPPAGELPQEVLESFFAPNIWPERPAGMREALLGYFDQARAVAHKVTRVLAVALGLPEDFFEEFTDHSTDTLRLNHYNPPPGLEPLPGQMRLGAHTDYGVVTVLAADPVPGLEILGPHGEWLGVVPNPGRLLVNLGDLMAQWTNDRWRSTLHRVVPTDLEGRPVARRRSIATFHDGNYDAVVACLPTCQGPDEPPRYPPVVAGAHLRAKFVGPRTFTPSKATSTTSGRL